MTARQDVFSVWEGVYGSFQEAGGTLDAFASDYWIKKKREEVLSQFTSLQTKELVPSCAISKDYQLPMVVVALLEQQQQVSILDFGGGMGSQYLDILAKVPTARERVTFTVVDGPATIANVPDELRRFRNLQFSEELDSVTGPFDIVHLGSVLPYVDDWRGLLQHLGTTYLPRYVVFSDLLAGEIPTFVSHQICYDMRIPHRFYSWPEICDFFTNTLKFDLAFQTKYIHKILNQEDCFPNFALPPEYQIDRAINAIFSRARTRNLSSTEIN